MNVLCLLGSPRVEGNSATIARRLCEDLVRRGAALDLHELASLRFSGCRNLFHCKTGSERCGLRDDLTPVLDSLYQADVLILASPIYFTDLSSDTKAVIERLFSFFVPDYVTNPIKSRLPSGMRLVLVQTQGEPEAQYADLLDRYAKSFRMLGIEETHLIRACGVREPGEVDDRADVWRRVEAVAETLLPR